MIIISLVFGALSAALISPTEFLSMSIGPPVAAIAGALYARVAHLNVRSTALSGVLALVGSLAVMFIVIAVFAFLFAILG